MQADLFGPNWFDAKESLPEPGKYVLCIHDHGDGPYMGVSMVVNDCCGNKDNPYYGRVNHGLLYWADQPSAPIAVR